MNSPLNKTILLAGFVALISSARGLAEEFRETEELWSCSGYCYMVGDTATNPWIPVSSSGASEDEARENIDCGQFVETGITCRYVRY